MTQGRACGGKKEGGGIFPPCVQLALCVCVCVCVCVERERRKKQKAKIYRHNINADSGGGEFLSVLARRCEGGGGRKEERQRE